MSQSSSHPVGAGPSRESPPKAELRRFGPPWATLLYVLLLSSAAVSLWTRGRAGAVPPGWERVAPGLFLAFLVGFALYRAALVRARKYPAGKALFQVGAAVLFLLVLLPRPRPLAGSDPLEGLLHDPSPAVRALAAEVARSRPEGKRYGPALIEALADVDPEVRAQAHRSLVQLVGEDRGEGPASAPAWSELFR